MMAGGGLPWEAVCRSVVDGISMVIHMTRREGRRYVEDAIQVGSYSLSRKRFEWKPLSLVLAGAQTAEPAVASQGGDSPSPGMEVTRLGPCG